MISLQRIRLARRSNPAHAPDVPSPTATDPAVETDAEFLAGLEREEATEKARILATYSPLPEDAAEYEAWARELDAGTLPPPLSGRFRSGEYHAIRTGQISEDEIAQLAAHGCI